MTNPKPIRPDPTVYVVELDAAVDKLVRLHRARKAREPGSRWAYLRARWRFASRYGSSGASQSALALGLQRKLDRGWAE